MKKWFVPSEKRLSVFSWGLAAEATLFLKSQTVSSAFMWPCQPSRIDKVNYTAVLSTI